MAATENKMRSNEKPRPDHKFLEKFSPKYFRFFYEKSVGSNKAFHKNHFYSQGALHNFSIMFTSLKRVSKNSNSLHDFYGTRSSAHSTSKTVANCANMSKLFVCLSC